MKKLLTFISLIFLFIAGFIITTEPSFSAFDKTLLLKNSTIEYSINELNDGTIQAYNLTEEHHLLNKKDNNNQINIIPSADESQLGLSTTKSTDSFSIAKALPHSNYSIISNRVYLTQASPRAP